MAAEGDSSVSAAPEGAQGVIVNVRCSNGSKIPVRTELSSTVGVFKSLVGQKCDIPADQQRLIYKGRILKDDQTLESYGLGADHTVHMVRAITPSAQTTPGTVPNARTVDATSNAPSARASDGSGLLDLDGLNRQFTQNPEMMRDLMDTPMVQNMLNNPEMLRSLIMNNPQMREVINRNPELAHVLSDPSILRQTMETARNPELMREMMRNTDIAMSNIESTPEGFNMLRRMYENVQEPFLSATVAGNEVNSASSNPSSALLGTQGVEQQRDGTNNSSTTGSESTTVAAPNTNPLPNPWGSAAGGNQTNTGSRAASANTRAPALGGIGNLPDIEQLLSGGSGASMGLLQNPALSEMMQNPAAASQMMQTLLSDSQYRNQILNSSQLRGLTEMHPELEAVLQNPETMRRLTSPEMLQQILSLQQSLLSPMNNSQSNQDSFQPGTTTGGENAPNIDLATMFRTFGLGAGQPENSNVAPEELYASQLSQLQEMGFFDTQENIRALQATRGNVHLAVERLLENLGQ